MANTGLLGINPYRGGNVAIDFTSKPTQLAISLKQKEQAKAEAVDKYFKDYEKSLNPAGLGKGELDMFTKKLREVQNYGIQNKQAVTNPSKYGYDAQSTLMAGFKDLQGYIEQSKQATAERKAFKDYINQAVKSGKHVSDNYLDVLNGAMKPVGAGYTPPDLSQIDIYDPHDDVVFTDKTWKNINLPSNIQYESEVVNGKPTERVKEVRVESITPEVAKSYAQKARGYYRDNLGTQEQYNRLAQDKNFVTQLNPIYKQYLGTDIKTPEDLLVAYGLATKQPERKDMTGYDYSKLWYQNKSKNDQMAVASYKQSLEDAAASDNFSNALTDLVGKGNQVKTIYNSATKKNEDWKIVPLPREVKSKFTSPVVEVSYDNANNPKTETKQKEFDYILVDSKGRFHGYNQKYEVDDNGLPVKVKGKFDDQIIDSEEIVSELLKPYTSTKNRSQAVKAALSGFTGAKTSSGGHWADKYKNK